MLKFNSNLQLLFSKLLVIRQAGEDIYVKENQAEVHLPYASVPGWGSWGVSAQSMGAFVIFCDYGYGCHTRLHQFQVHNIVIHQLYTLC